KTRKQMKSAMTYPLVIFVFATGVIIFILIFVIPEFVGIYKEMDAELPTITKIIIDISNFLRKNIFYLLMGLFAIFLIFKALYKSVKAFRTIVQWVMMHVAVFGKIIIYNEVTTFTKTFGSLLNHNVFITDSMEVLSKITNNEIYKMLIFDTITNLAKGGIISNAFKNHWAFPVIAYEMLLTGEKTGELGDMMMKVSDYFQLQHKNSVTQIKTFIEPLMIVFLTVLVGIILMSVILPMFNMYTEIM
ncbi:MAG: type II secretion system F family protein, partial [Bacilli bacterium]|nr:type II secretion system F family protein [Bacilli bacterium]